MNNDKLIINESVSIEDNASSFPKGFIVIRDETGKILVKKHNMIVSTGKEYIYQKFIKSALNLNNFSHSTNMDDYTLSFVRFGNGLNETIFTQVLAGDNENRYLEKSEITEGDIETGTDNNHYYIKITKRISADSNISISSISEIELILSNATKDSFILFSRARFDSIPISAGVSFSLDYYIYF